MKLGFIGIGKISCSLVEAFCTAEIDDLKIYLSHRNTANATRLANEFSVVEKMGSNQEVLEAADVIFLAVRPDDVRGVVSNLSFDQRHEVISMIPFLEYPELVEVVAPAASACRAIPLPSVVHHVCPIPMFPGADTGKKLLSRIGQPLIMQTEDELHKIWALTGFISPFYDMMGTLSQWAVDQGVNEKTANTYIVDMFQSLATVAQKTDPLDFDALAKHAATTKGMNEQAGREIREKGAHQAYYDSADGLYKRIVNRLMDSTAD